MLTDAVAVASHETERHEGHPGRGETDNLASVGRGCEHDQSSDYEEQGEQPVEHGVRSPSQAPAPPVSGEPERCDGDT